MLPIYVCWDSGIDEIEEEAILAALQCFEGPNITVFGSKAWAKGDYSSADWYIQHTEKVQGNLGGIQLNADHLFDLIVSEPWQMANPHIDIMIVSKDMTAFEKGQQLNYVFGIADGPITVQSVARFRECSDEDRTLAVKTIVWHELGHIFGAAADLNRNHTEYNLGPHCTNYGCVMKQGDNVPKWIKNAREADKLGRIYCPECLADMGAH